MNPIRVTATAYRSYDQLDLALPSGAFAITGRNGAGKSSILLLIDLCLFGGRDLSRYMNRTRGEVMRIGLEVEHRDALYRIQRSYNPAGRGKTTLDFEVSVDDEQPSPPPWWRSLTEGNARDTQTLIEATFGLSRETFRASAYLSQGDAAAFTEADAADRKRILADVLGLGVWDAVLDVAKRDRGIAQEQLAKAQATIDLATELGHALDSAAKNRDEAAEVLAGHSEVVDRVRVAAAGCLERLEDAKAGAAKREEAAGRARLAEQEYAAADRDLTQIEQSRAAALAEIERVDAARPLAGQLSDLEARAAQIAVRIAERAGIAARMHTLDDQFRAAGARYEEAQRWIQAGMTDLRRFNNQLDEINDAGAVCETCGQPLVDAEARGRAKAAVTAQITETTSRVADMERQAGEAEAEQVTLREQRAVLVMPESDGADAVQAALHAARGAAAVLAGEAAARDRLSEAEAANPKAAERLTAADTALVEARADVAALGVAEPLEDLERAYRAAHSDVARAEEGLGSLTARHEQAKGRWAELSERIAALGDPQADLAASAAEITILDQLVEAYGRNGVPALIIETSALPHLEGEANRILADLGTSMLVELRTQRALKTGPGVRETLDIIVKMDGAEALYEDFSGGERSRLNVSLRIALARLLAHRRGSDVRMLVLDEPEYLDDAGTAQLAQVLHGLTGDFERVALVSHVTGLQDAFDTVITVERDEGDVSRIVA